MSPQNVDDWSDSDEDEVADVETSVQLGIPDGPLESASDRLDAAVSRIGGHPAFLTSPEPPVDSGVCKNCSTPMELLLQVWCPAEDSPSDRVLYVWGCSRGVCQRLEGSVRAWRGLRFNEKYAAKLENKKAKQREKELAQTRVAGQKSERIALPNLNPFSMNVPSNAPSPFGLGSQIFGSPDHTSPENDRQQSDDDEEAYDSDTDEEETSLVTAFASSTLESSEWPSFPAYDCLYLSTVGEYLPPPPKLKIPQGAQVNEDGIQGNVQSGGWTMESYENSIDVDQVFERFSKRVGYEGEQCLRYELGGTPLPFASDKIFDRLFPVPPQPNLPITRPDSMVVPAAKRTYNASSIPTCPYCDGKRVFECQLMPNLINVLSRAGVKEQRAKQTDEERRKEVERALKGGTGVERTGMEWGTCMVFSCEQNCCLDNGSPVKGCWREEIVLVQWDI
ncbi:hypothetical protein BDW22DRAFT_1407066 [Trametopsis cervina]|nr:hypothetical protein BDW22DRAFT_1407066 [Trametopsis cervina]